MNLRPYQIEARDAVLSEWQGGRARTLLVLPTGTGKTIVFSAVIAERVAAGERVLVLAHRGELWELVPGGGRLGADAHAAATAGAVPDGVLRDHHH